MYVGQMYETIAAKINQLFSAADKVVIWRDSVTGTVFIRRSDGTDVPLTSTFTSTEDIVAFAGGGQQIASPLTSRFNVVRTVATLGDSLTLPDIVASTVGTIIEVKNLGANALDLFPNTDGRIDGAGANVAISVAPAGTSVKLVATKLDGASDPIWTSF